MVANTPFHPVIAAVMYSPNLGDGAIATCIDHAIRQQFTGVEPGWLDLAGRTEFPRQAPKGRQAAIDLLARLPSPVDRLIGEQLIRHQVRSRLAPLLARVLPSASALVVGGGQLLSDVHMNFPVKLAALGARSEQLEIPMVIHGVGVAQTWHPRAAALFGTLLGNRKLASVCVRDEASRENLLRHAGEQFAPRGRLDIRVAPDPAFLARDAFDLHAPAATTGRIGLGVTHPSALQAHGDEPAPSAQTVISNLAALASNLVATGFRPVLFTNGAFEDEAFLSMLRASGALAGLGSGFEVAARASTPADLAGLLAGFDGVIAHRLHANILSFALGGVPVGLAWDAKMRGFFDIIGEPGLLQPSACPDPAKAVASLQDGMRRRAEMGQRARELSVAARAGVLESLNCVC
ncbi:polysaccharide pyruvyl transferase family protein [Maricaulis sp.]|uniref:polysaccharide pyruvyl transferase family protein n=1 Tax=Maricaulis sp. TaxID=1486257 RepID=UPI003A8DB48B